MSSLITIENLHIHCDPEKLDRILAHVANLEKTMAKVDEALAAFQAKQDAHNAKMDTGLNDLNTAVDGLGADVQGLKDVIATLPTAGDISPAQQAILDDIDAKMQVVEDRVTALSTKAKALDDMTPPVVPPTP